MSTNQTNSWKALQEGVKFTLPDSGLEVWLRPVDFTIFAVYGGLPDTLMSTVMEAALSGDQGKIVADAPNLMSKGVAEFRQLMEAYARCAFVTPRVVDDPQGDNEISLGWLGFKDLQFVYGMFNLTLPQMIELSDQQSAAPDQQPTE